MCRGRGKVIGRRWLLPLPLLLALVTFSLSAAGDFIRVEDREGHPLPGAWFACGGPAPAGSVVATAGRNGRLPWRPCPGGRRAWVGAPGHLPVAVFPSPEGQIIRLSPGAAVAGRIVSPGGRPVAGVVVEVRDRLRRLTTITGDDGGFRLGGVVPGEVILRARAKGSPGVEMTLVAGLPTVPPVNLVLPGRAFVRPVAGDRDGEARARGTVRLRIRAADRNGTRYLDEAGRVVAGGETVEVRVGDLLHDPLPAGVPLAIDAWLPECAPSRTVVTLSPGEQALHLPCSRGFLAGRVVLPREEGADGVTVRVCVHPRGTVARELLAGGRTCSPADADGRWTIGPLPPGAYDIDADSPGGYYLPGGVEGRVATTGTVVVPELRLRRGLVLAGRLETDDGPAPGAMVRAASAASGSRWRSTTKTDPRGDFRLVVPGAGPWILEARLAGRPPAFLRGVRAPRSGLRLRLGPGAGLRFDLVDPDGMPFPEARVLVYDPDGGGLRQAVRAGRKGDGPLEVHGLAPGRGTLKILARGFLPVVLPRVPLAAGEVRDLGRLVAGRGRRVEGIVLGPDDMPVAGATVRVAVRDAREQACEAESDGDGHLVLTGVPRSSVDLLVTAHGLAPRVVRLPPETPGTGSTGDGELEIRLLVGGEIACRVEDAAGRPVEGALVVVAGLADLVRGETGPDGVTVLEHVPPGTRTVRAVRDAADPTVGIAERTLAVVDGTRREVVLHPGAGISGSVSRRGAPVAATRLVATITGGGRGVASTWTDEDGLFHLELSSPGTWTLTVEGDSCRYHLPLRVPEDGLRDVRVELPAEEVCGRVVDEEDGQGIPDALVAWTTGKGGSRGNWFVELPGGGREWVSWDLAPGATSRTDGEGEWCLCVPARGPFELSAEASSRYDDFRRECEEVPASPLVVPLRRRGFLLHVRVRTAKGGMPESPAAIVVESSRGYRTISFVPTGGDRTLSIPPGPFRVWAMIRGYGMARMDWVDPERDTVPEDGLPIMVPPGGWLRVSLAPALAEEADPEDFSLRLLDGEGNDLFGLLRSTGLLDGRPTGAPGEVLLGSFPRGTWTLEWRAGRRGGHREVLVDESPPPVVLGGGD